jgi:hypothetical protein
MAHNLAFSIPSVILLTENLRIVKFSFGSLPWCVHVFLTVRFGNIQVVHMSATSSESMRVWNCTALFFTILFSIKRKRKVWPHCILNKLSPPSVRLRERHGRLRGTQVTSRKGGGIISLNINSAKG